MKRELASFTCYGIEYVYDFLGKERIDKRINELIDKPTLGLKLERVAYGDPEYGYVSKAGVLWIFNILIDSFFKEELDLAIFLYQKSKDYNETNYFEGGLLKEKWEDNLKTLDVMSARNPNDTEYWQGQKINPYWMEYHFFYQTIVKVFIKRRSDPKIKELLMEIFDDYLSNSDKITARFKLDGLMWPANGLGSEIYADMEEFYFENNEKDKLKLVWKKAYSQGWRAAFYYEDDEENEEDL